VVASSNIWFYLFDGTHGKGVKRRGRGYNITQHFCCHCDMQNMYGIRRRSVQFDVFAVGNLRVVVVSFFENSSCYYRFLGFGIDSSWR